MQNSIEFLDMNTADGRLKSAAYKAQKQALVEQGQQIFAKIKKSSKYYGQGERGALFPVHIAAWMRDYHVQGGPGGQYRLADVNLFVVEDGEELRIS